MIAKPKSSGSGSSSSGSKTTYITTTVSDADHAASADKATRAENADRATYADRAGTAQNAAYATVAGSLSKDAEVLDDYLYKGETDETQEVKGKVTFDDTITAKTEIIAELLRSLDYANAAEQGFSIEKEDSGKYHEYITNLTVWGKAIFHELEIRKLSYAGGNIYLSGAGSKLVKVVPVKWDSTNSTWATSTDAECEGWKCYLLADDGTTATQNYWQENDQVRCQTFGQITSAGTYTDVSNKAYWRTIPANGISTANEKIYADDGTTELYDGQQFAWIVIGKHSESLDGYTEDTAPTETKDYPATGDTIVLDGNRGTDTSRQNIIILETTGDDAPRIAGYHNITDYEHTASNYVFLFSAKEGVTLNTSCFKWTTAGGSEINMPNYCGDWTESTTYYKNDQVSHNNAVWICVANSGVAVTDEPSDTSSNWKKVLSGGKGDKGDSGDGVVMAYKNADTQPSKPTVTDLSQLTSEGWSRTPQQSDTFYGEFSSGAGTTLDETAKEWTSMNDGTNTWMKSPSGLDSAYGWTLMKVSFITTAANVKVPVVLKAYSEENYDYIDIHELDTEEAWTTSLRGSGVAKASGDGTSVTYEYNVPTAGKHFFYVSYCKDSSGSENGDYGLIRLDISGNSGVYVPSSITWMSQAILQDDKAVLPWSDPIKITGEDGAQGVNGNDGKSALEIVVSPDTLVFDTDDSGLVSSSASKSATITCYRDGAQVTDIKYQLGDHDNCGAIISPTNGGITVTISNIDTDAVTDDGTTYNVSKTSGTVDVSITDLSTGTTYKAQVKFAVNVSKFTGGIMADNKKFQTVYNELTNNGSSTDLTDFKSEIAQTAREISLEVSQKTVGRRNMLVGSAARKYGEGWIYMSGGASYNGVPVERIEINSGIDGTNCLHCYASSSYPMGFHWVGTSPQGNVKLVKGKTYTLSCYVKTNAAGYVEFFLETHMMSSATATSRSISNYSGIEKHIDYSDTWTLLTSTFTMSESYEYAEICIFAYPDSGVRDIHFCRPMLEEGDTANGWTLSEQDYDYVGGNLLDNTRTLTKEGNLFSKEGTLIEEGYGGSNVQHIDCSSSSSDMDPLIWYNQSSSPLTIALNNDYIFSFWAKGSGTLNLYCYCADDNRSTVQYENSDGKSGTAGDGRNTITLTSQWKRHWVHWKAIASPLPTSVVIRCPGYSDAYVTQPKLEEGATLTEWTERKADLIDKASLKAAGISISSSSVELYGDQIKVSGTKGGEATALFNDGKVVASHIDVESLMAQSMTATNLTVSGNSKFGIWSIGSDSTWGDMIQASGTMTLPNGNKVNGDGILYMPFFLQGGTTDSTYFRVGPQCTEFGYHHDTYGYAGLWLGLAAKYVCNGETGTSMKTPEGLNYDSNSYNPAAYIYARRQSASDPAMAIYIVPKGGSYTYTALKTNGAICGVPAPNTANVSSDGTVIANTVGTVICTNSSEITIYLPPNPIDGQTLLIIQGAKNVNIKTNGKTMYCSGKIYSDSTIYTTIATGRFNLFVYINGYWQLRYF